MMDRLRIEIIIDKALNEVEAGSPEGLKVMGITNYQVWAFIKKRGLLPLLAEGQTINFHYTV